MLSRLIGSDRIDLNTNVVLYICHKLSFFTLHSLISNARFTCESQTVSFVDRSSSLLNQCGSIIVFLPKSGEKFALIQKYRASHRRLSHYVDLPNKLCEPIDRLFPLLILTDDHTIISALDIFHRCVSIPFIDCARLSEMRIDHDHDWSWTICENLWIARMREMTPIGSFLSQMMSSTDQYAKQYVTKRRTNKLKITIWSFSSRTILSQSSSQSNALLLSMMDWF